MEMVGSKMRKMERLFQYGMKEGRWLLFDVHVDDHFEENCIFLFILGSQLPEFRKETSKKQRKREETNDEVSYLADETDLEILFTLVIKTKVISGGYRAK